MWPLGLESVEFKEAVEWFRSRTPITRAAWDAMAEAARKKAFMVSGVAQLDVITDVWRALDKAVEQGLTLEDFKADVGDKLIAAWAGTVENPAWRLETIFRTNVQTAYSAGRYRQHTAPETLEDRPYWTYDAILDGRETSICHACDGTTLPANHAFWTTHVPPLHFNCRSCIVALTRDDAVEAGLTLAPTAEPAKGFGAPPGEDDWSPDPAKYPAELWKLLTEKDLPPVIHLPKPPTPAENILHEKVGEAKGSNAGGFYVGRDGVKRYVKFYEDGAQAHGEHLANSIYRDLGFEAPVSTVFAHDGKVAYASVVVEGAQTLGAAGLTTERAKAVMTGFVADVLTANWDAVGLAKDNILVLADGRLMRVDNGGTFLMRAKAGRKGQDVLDTISEWTKLRDRSVNPVYAEVAKAAGMSTDSRLKPTAVRGIKAVLALRARLGSWTAYVEQAAGAMPAADKARVIEMLEARTAHLEDKLKELTAKKPRKPRVKKNADTFVLDLESKEGKKVLEKIAELQDRSKRDAFYADLFAKAGVSGDDFARTRGDIGSWVSEYRLGSAHTRLYGAYAKVKGQDTEHPVDPGTAERFARVQDSRAARWRLFMEAIGEKAVAPTHIRSYRGVYGQDSVVDVARSWADESVEFTTVASHEIASWSMHKTPAEAFAKSNSAHNVVFTWDAPLADTTHDQAIDDAAFISSFFSEHEVIAGKGHDKGVPLPKSGALVTYDGVRYTYDEREKLIGKLRARGLL